ncbi:MAG: Gfo/Idh/MocA family oxidoreductase [Anaerolineae bacterium]|nr:Gfo/Idh/MocA family oxidoreductase [Anaerolineae bacterium]
MLKAAVIGVGSIGRNHARVYSEINNDIELVAVVDTHAETAKQVGNMRHVPAYSDIEAMLDREKPDVVSVAVPTETHLEIARLAIERGIHVLVEKPIASTVEEAHAMIDLAERAGVVLAVGHVERHNPAITELSKRVQDGALGKIFQMTAHRVGPFPARIRDVGVVLDLATHDLDVMCSIVHEPVVRVTAETIFGINTDREDMVNGMIRFANGVVGVLDINWMTPTKIREFSVVGALGMFRANYLTQELYFYENDDAPGTWDQLSVLTGVGEGNITGVKINRTEPLRAEILDFINAVKNNGEPRVTGRDGLRALQLAQALVDAGKKEAPIVFEVEKAL